MIHYILIPFIRINDAELVYFEEDTHTFVEINEDCCEKQRMGTLKTESCLFLQKLSDNSVYIMQTFLEDEKQKQKYISTYIIRYVIGSIQHQLQIADISKDQFLRNQKIPTSAPVLPIETSFLVLSIFSYCLEEFPE